MLADTTSTRFPTEQRVAFIVPLTPAFLGLCDVSRRIPIRKAHMFERYSTETWVCSIKGHVTPAAEAAELGPEHVGVGIDIEPQGRLARCLRCDAWIACPRPAGNDRLAPLEEFELPRRGEPLRQAVLLRLISIERGVHSVIFAVIAILGLLVRSRLAGIQSGIRSFLDTLTQTEAQTGRATNHSILAREGTRVLHLNTRTLEVLIITAAVYAVIEGVEAVGLWLEKRWAEYQIHELTKKLTVVRVGAFVVNIAILCYLVYAKRLFGVRRHRADEPGAAGTDRSIFSTPF